MPYYRSWFSSRKAAEAAAATALDKIDAMIRAGAKSDAAVVAGTAAASAVPTSRFECIGLEAVGPGAIPATAAPCARIAWKVTTADGADAIVHSYQQIPSIGGGGGGGDGIGFGGGTGLVESPPAVGDVEYHAVGSELAWRTRVSPAADGRWAVELFTVPEGT